MKKMVYRTFGKTGLAMPVFSCGLMRSMYSWQDQPCRGIPGSQQKELAAVVDGALSRGITHLETARAYGSSERQLSSVLADYPRDAFILQTKVRPEDDPNHFTANVLDSLKRLGQRRVNLLALHGVNDHRSLWQACRPGGCLAAARKLQQQGRADWIGFSGHGDREVIAQAVMHEGDGGFDYLNLHWYTIWQRNSPVLALAAERNLGVFIISPTDKGGMLQHPPEKLSALSKPLTPMQFNDLYCLQRPEIHTISIGAARTADFIDHVALLPQLADREPVEQIYQRWQQTMSEACGDDRPDGLWQRLPPWQQTPGYINTGFILWLYNLARGWDLLEFARRRYRMLGREMDWVPGNDAACAGEYDFENIAAGAGISCREFTGLLQCAHLLLGRDQPKYQLLKEGSVR